MIDAPNRAAFVATYGHLFEHSPWVVERAWDGAPFRGEDELFTALTDVVSQAGKDEVLKLFRAHPELGVRQALTDASEAEQAGAGLKHLSADEYQRFSVLNAAYREKFGFPFIICVRLQTRQSIFAAFERRLGHDEAAEFTQARAEVLAITRLRLHDMKLEAIA